MTGGTPANSPLRSLSAPTRTGAIDQSAVRAAARRARRLFTGAPQPDDVIDVTVELRGYVAALIPACRAIADRLPPNAPGRPRINASVAVAEPLLTGQPGFGSMSALVHMQLLADSAQILASYVREADR